ncbi:MULTISPECIES: hypothetical protein [unclassified Pseudomonas]|jgi:hypothetical protein|nr:MULTISPECIES: hypothetical protein [unclassified Pseudomonas]MEB0227559.1 hypothetical protein [Pseudomonas sp. 5S1]MEB0297259.1 hypothetical protein [Pseudomonas sp. 10S4]WPX15995.1 hypothetical protein RHM58_17960 [Pseudomonas sp. 10S4]
MNSLWPRIVVAGVGALLLALAWWGWHQGGLALMQLGMGAC